VARLGPKLPHRPPDEVKRKAEEWVC